MTFQEVLDHFQAKEPFLVPFIEGRGERILVCNPDTDAYFHKLCQDIISQQLSIKVADVIIQRFETLLGSSSPTPEMILEIPDQKLRDVGMSWAKIKYVKDLALKTSQKELPFKRFPDLENEAVIAELVKVKGIGRWTAEMFLIFTLGREDVFSHGDLGLRNALTKLYKLEHITDKKAFAAKAEEITQKWAPYRSYGSLALWWSLKNEGQS